MILAEIKKEDYRENKAYWTQKLYWPNGNPKHYDAVQLTNGYNPDSPAILMDYHGVDLGKPNPDWCPPEDHRQTLYRIKLGEFITFHNVPEKSKPLRFRDAGN